MDQYLAMTAMVMSFPPGLKQPELLPEENVVRFVIRHHHNQWQNFMERLEKRFGIPKSLCAELHKPGKIENLSDPNVLAEIEEFLNMRLPVHNRTIKDLSELRQDLKDPYSKMMHGFDLVQILFPRERAQSGQKSEDIELEKEFRSLGAEVLFVENGLRTEIDFSDLLPSIKGELVWVLPGGTTFSSSLAVMSLSRVVEQFKQEPKVAMYFDGTYSFVYRTSALHNLFNKGGSLSSNTQLQFKLFKESGYKVTGDSGRDFALCELEQCYGGTMPTVSESAVPPASSAGFWRKLFGK